MNTLIKYILSFAAGSAIGSGVTWIFSKKKFEKKLNEEIQKIEDCYKSLEGEKELEKEEQTVENETHEAPEEYRSSEAHEDALVRKRERKSVTQNTHAVDYTKYFKSESGGDTKEMHFEELEHPKDDGAEDKEYEENYYSGLEATRELRNGHGTKFIKAVDFGSDPSLSTMSLLYYQDNDTLVVEGDSTDEVIDDFNEVEDMLGDGLSKYGFKDNDEPVIYIRNYDRGYDYEVTKVFDSYGGDY